MWKINKWIKIVKTEVERMRKSTQVRWDQGGHTRPLLSFLIQYRAGETHHGLIGDSLLPPKPAFAALSRFFGARRLSGHHAMSLSLCYSLMSSWCFLCSTSSCQTHREISNSEVFILSSVWFPRKCRKGEELEVCILVFFFFNYYFGLWGLKPHAARLALSLFPFRFS